MISLDRREIPVHLGVAFTMPIILVGSGREPTGVGVFIFGVCGFVKRILKGAVACAVDLAR